MILLSLDTTTRAGSAAVLRDGVVLAERTGDPSLNHGERLPVELMRVLDEAGVRIADVELFAVAAGPGSFTGLRVGIATIQGLAVARGRLVVPVSALDALARAAVNAVHPIWAWMDAQRGEVFAALYSPDGRDVLAEPVSALPQTVLARAGELHRGADPIFAGDGAVRYAEVITSCAPGALIVPPPPLAGIVGQIAAADVSKAVQPHAVVPIYIRRPDAEIARDRRSAGVQDGG